MLAIVLNCVSIILVALEIVFMSDTDVVISFSVISMLICGILVLIATSAFSLTSAFITLVCQFVLFVQMLIRRL